MQNSQRPILFNTVQVGTAWNPYAVAYFNAISAIPENKALAFNTWFDAGTVIGDFFFSLTQVLFLRNVDAASCMVNAISPAVFAAATVGSVSFTAWSEMAGNGVDAYIDTNCAPDVLGQDNAGCGLFVTDTHSAPNSFHGSDAFVMLLGLAGNSYAYMNEGTLGVIAADTLVNDSMYYGQRSASNREDLYKDGVSIGNAAQASIAPSANSVLFFCRRLFGNPNGFSAIGAGATFIGDGLSGPQNVALFNATQQLMSDLL